MASIRQQFSRKENIQLSLWSVQFLRSIAEHLSVPGEDPPDLQFIEGGYMFLATRVGEHQLRENYKLQRLRHGASHTVHVHESIRSHIGMNCISDV